MAYAVQHVHIKTRDPKQTSQFYIDNFGATMKAEIPGRAVSRHLLWTLPHPDRAMDEWIRVLRRGGRLIVVDSQADFIALPEPLDNARSSPKYAATGSGFPVAGRARRS